MSDIDTKSQSHDSHYKFMANILIEPKHRSKYISQLEKVTVDPRVPFQRLIISLVAFAAVAISGVWIMLGDSHRMQYVALPALVYMIAGSIIILYYMLSSRDESMLKTAIDMFLFNLGEKARLHVMPNGSIMSVGIRRIRHGVIEFDDDDFGLLYDVEGHMSFSILPALADKITMLKNQYIVGRSDTCQETLITFIQPADLTKQLAAFDAIYKETVNATDLSDAWRAYMAKINYDYISDNMACDETVIHQCLLLRETDLSSLKKAKEYFESQVSNGLYSSVKIVGSESAIMHRLGGLTLMSDAALGR